MEKLEVVNLIVADVGKGLVNFGISALTVDGTMLILQNTARLVPTPAGIQINLDPVWNGLIGNLPSIGKVLLLGQPVASILIEEEVATLNDIPYGITVEHKSFQGIPTSIITPVGLMEIELG